MVMIHKPKRTWTVIKLRNDVTKYDYGMEMNMQAQYEARDTAVESLNAEGPTQYVSEQLTESDDFQADIATPADREERQ